MSNEIIDNFWVIVSAVLVFLMQPGFMCLESGLTRPKNSINVAIKNIADFVFSVIGFWVIGFGLMFGLSRWGLIGTTSFFPEFGDNFHLMSFFLFQTMFCGTATTIFSGAVAERMKFSSYLQVAILLSALIYPVFGHWAWNGLDIGTRSGWLGKAGFVDFAGSTVVHSIGGWVALAALIVIGPRHGRFAKNGKPVDFHGNDLPLSVLGTLLLWIGWIGFNGGSTLAMDARVSGIIVKTLIAGASGAICCLFIGYCVSKLFNIAFLINGSLGGLVAITACCHCVTISQSVFIGGVAGILCLVVEDILLRYRIDDAVSAVPVHLGCGIWGTLAVALFGDPQTLGTGLSFLSQLQSQITGIIAAFFAGFIIPFLIIRKINRISPLRVSIEEERMGLNISEHGAKTETFDFLQVMQVQEQTGDLSLRVPADPFSDTGVIAGGYNKMMDALQNMGERFQQLFNGSPQAVVSTNASGHIIHANKGFEILFGYPAATLCGAHNLDLIVPENLRLEAATLRQVISSGKTIEKETKRRHKSGRLIPVSLLGFPIMINNRIEGEFFIYQDITERKVLEDQLYRKAFYDSMTGLPNRVLFLERLTQTLKRQKRNKQTRLAVFLIDLDRFKWVNDNLGHQTGDFLLKKVANRFLACVRSMDTVARLGGDEFAVLLEEISDARQIITIARRIRNETARPFMLKGKEALISASIGIILDTRSYTRADDILRDVDIAMYRAKTTGKSKFRIFGKKLQQIAHDALQLENDLKTALENGQFTLFYQPIIASKTGKLKGFEALIRWNHPTRGMIPPSDFIPIAEENGQIISIGQWVIETACRQLKEWQDQSADHKHLTINVNISVQQFTYNNLEKIVEAALNETGLAAHCLVAELTESAVIDKPEAVIGHLNRLKKSGIKIALDDFGTGYFSLSYLKNFPWIF
ncbi:MAG: ammonium transporter [Desulfobacterales bacterium]|nr:ammonium transporter [Desulfobacterales bacterium]